MGLDGLSMSSGLGDAYDDEYTRNVSDMREHHKAELDAEEGRFKREQDIINQRERDNIAGAEAKRSNPTFMAVYGEKAIQQYIEAFRNQATSERLQSENDHNSRVVRLKAQQGNELQSLNERNQERKSREASKARDRLRIPSWLWWLFGL